MVSNEQWKKEQSLLKNHKADVIINSEATEFDLSSDTYCNAFRANHKESAKRMELKTSEWMNALQSAFMVFCVQLLLLYFVAKTLFSDGLKIPPSTTVFAARFICVILMHLQVEGDLRNGLQLMKYATNHPREFFMPKAAWFVGFMQFFGGVLCELACVLFLSTINEIIFIVIKFIALGSIAKIDDFYAAALPEENKVKKNRGKAVMESKNHRRLYNTSEDRSCGIKTLSVVTKICKMFYAAFIFYFIPFVTILLPYAISGDSTPEYSATLNNFNLESILI